MDEAYRVKVYMVGVDKELARNLREVLGKYVKGAGKTTLKDMMRRAHEGERVLVYETNSDEDAIRVARAVQGGGADVEIDGLKPPEEPF